MPTKKSLRRKRSPSNRATKKPLRRKRAPSKRTSSHTASPPRPRAAHILDLALAYRLSAKSTKDPREVAIALVLDAALLAELRRERSAPPTAAVPGAPMPARATVTGKHPLPAELEGLRRAAVKYVATRDETERWAFDLPPGPRGERTVAIKRLCSVARDGLAWIRDRPSGTQPAAAKMVANVLLAEVDKLGLAADQVDRTPANQHLITGLELQARAKHPRVDRVAALALQCRGVSRERALNWARAGFSTEVK